MNSLEYLRSLDKVVIPTGFTYFNHCTGYLPEEVKKKMVSGKYVKEWTNIPIDNFLIVREMSFVERNERVSDCLRYRNPLSQVPIIYQLRDYCRPFMIRVVMPKKSIISNDMLIDPYISELNNIYHGLGDNRHQKLPGKTKLLVFASSQVDEISNKKVDIIYCVREKDLDWYTYLVNQTLTKRTPKEFVLSEQIDWKSSLDFLEGDLLLERDRDFSRYIGSNGNRSEFEEEYYDIFGDFIQKYLEGDSLKNMSYEDYSLICKMFQNTYAEEKNKKVI